MFEKFTERGRKVIIYAREEAEKRQNDYLGTEHLLLAILREDLFYEFWIEYLLIRPFRLNLLN